MNRCGAQLVQTTGIGATFPASAAVSFGARRMAAIYAPSVVVFARPIQCLGSEGVARLLPTDVARQSDRQGKRILASRAKSWADAELVKVQSLQCRARPNDRCRSDTFCMSCSLAWSMADGCKQYSVRSVHASSCSAQPERKRVAAALRKRGRETWPPQGCRQCNPSNVA